MYDPHGQSASFYTYSGISAIGAMNFFIGSFTVSVSHTDSEMSCAITVNYYSVDLEFYLCIPSGIMSSWLRNIASCTCV